MIGGQNNHVRWITSCITILSAMAFTGGTILIFKGYNGDLLIGGGLAGISGLVGMLSVSKPNVTPADISISGQPPKVEVTHPVEPAIPTETPTK